MKRWSEGVSKFSSAYNGGGKKSCAGVVEELIPTYSLGPPSRELLEKR